MLDLNSCCFPSHTDSLHQVSVPKLLPQSSLLRQWERPCSVASTAAGDDHLPHPNQSLVEAATFTSYESYYAFQAQQQLLNLHFRLYSNPPSTTHAGSICLPRAATAVHPAADLLQPTPKALLGSPPPVLCG